MKYYLAEVTVMCPYPKTFTYRVSGRTKGRCYDFAWREMRKEPQCKGRRDVHENIKLTQM